jgi:hypothetical protein
MPQFRMAVTFGTYDFPYTSSTNVSTVWVSWNPQQWPSSPLFVWLGGDEFHFVTKVIKIENIRPVAFLF